MEIDIQEQEKELSTLQELHDYVRAHTDQGVCRCENCNFEKVLGAEPYEYHAINMFFFDVSFKGKPTAEEFIRLTNGTKGAFSDMNPLDGQEHNYIELGGWIGDQGIAMRYMALGKKLGLWEIMHPGMIFDLSDPKNKALANQMAGMGMVSILGK